MQLTVDGLMGPATANSAHTAWDHMDSFLVNAVVEERRAFYRRIVERDPSQRRFLDGWLNRVAAFEVTI